MESKMTKILISKYGNSVIVDCTNAEDPKIEDLKAARSNIDEIFVVPTDCEVIVNKKDGVQKLNAKAGQILVVFYHNALKHKAVLIDCPEWIENINAYKEYLDNLSRAENIKPGKVCEADC